MRFCINRFRFCALRLVQPRGILHHVRPQLTQLVEVLHGKTGFFRHCHAFVSATDAVFDLVDDLDNLLPQCKCLFRARGVQLLHKVARAKQRRSDVRGDFFQRDLTRRRTIRAAHCFVDKCFDVYAVLFHEPDNRVLILVVQFWA